MAYNRNCKISHNKFVKFICALNAAVRLIGEEEKFVSMKSFVRSAQRALAALAAVSLISSAVVMPITSMAQAPAATAAPAATPVEAAPAAVAAPAPAPAPFQPGKPVVEKVENPYGVKALWNEGDIVARTTLTILIIMSIGTWYIMISKLLELSKIGRQAKAAEESFWSAPSVAQGVDTLKEQSPYRFISQAALDSTKKHDGLLAHISFSEWVSQSIQRATESVQSNMQNGLAFLASVASTAPFVGLFGTVWGIYNALVKIGVSGQASIDKVAGPVGEALIMTAIGLAVAVPAVLGYNFIVRKNKTTLEKIRNFGSDLHSVLIGSAAAAAAAGKR